MPAHGGELKSTQHVLLDIDHIDKSLAIRKEDLPKFVDIGIEPSSFCIRADLLVSKGAREPN
jgi:hypothetical protein